MLLMLAVLACAPTIEEEEEDDFFSDGTTPEEDEEEPCTNAIWLNGRPSTEAPNPQVGDSWSVLLYCDDALQTGPAVLQIEPPDMAQIDDTNPIITFVQAGEATILLQVGNRSASADVTIEE